MTPMIMGLIGAFIILLAFFMNQIHKWKSDSVIYDIANIIGSLLLAYYSYDLKAWPFLVLNLIWAGVSLRELQVDSAKKKKKRGHLGHRRH
ncbi:hypothetical protein KY310_02915 [Candidatus Woesearchaeota archaeon]|nr:hypothetical protein [Candidatus Woesearchaeota archaeon]